MLFIFYESCISTVAMPAGFFLSRLVSSHGNYMYVLCNIRAR